MENNNFNEDDNIADLFAQFGRTKASEEIERKKRIQKRNFIKFDNNKLLTRNS